MFTRRRFLLTMATVSAVAAAAAYIGRPYLAKLVRPELDTTFPLGNLQENEMRTIVAFGEMLVSPESIPPADFFREYVNTATQNEPGFLKVYQSTAKLLDVTSTNLFVKREFLQFYHLSRAEREKALQKLLWRYDASDRTVRKLEKIAASQDAITMRVYVMMPLIDYYYRSAYGWAVVGYESFPGKPPLDPRAYTRPLNDKGIA